MNMTVEGLPLNFTDTEKYTRNQAANAGNSRHKNKFYEELLQSKHLTHKKLIIF